MTVTISPSILNSDLTDLGGQLDAISNADYAHVDVMDGHFVPNLTWGLPIVEAVCLRGTLPVDVHLMIEDPDRWAPEYAQVGADSVTFHVEAAHAPMRLARELHSKGALVGVALNPGTAIEDVYELLGVADMVLVMTVEPGFGGQPFIDSMLDKVKRLRKRMSATGQQLAIQVDGGVTPENIQAAATAGADVFVAGSAVFRSPDPGTTVAQLRQLAQQAAREVASHQHGEGVS